VGNVAALIAATTATTIDDGDVWQNATPTVQAGAAVSAGIPINDGQDITFDILTATITAGVVDMYCLWRPLSSDANVTVTTPA
jgi:hypothetical protein